jgi:hypothetical protein
MAMALTAGAAVAQSQTPAPAPRRFVAIGCLTAQTTAGAKPATTFIVTDPRGEKPTIYRLEGDVEAFKRHTGHTVEVAGPLSPAPAAARNPVAAAPLMKVQTLTWIASACEPPSGSERK